MSRAAYLRAHRAAFTLALELGITPREAEAEIRRIEARERHRAAADQLAARMAAPVTSHKAASQAASDAAFDAPWMMRN